MTAVYLFEQPPPALGIDSSGHGNDLVELNGPEQNTTEFVEGAASMYVTSTVSSGLRSVDPVPFESPAGTNLTYGGWFRTSAHSGGRPITKRDTLGYDLRRDNGYDAAVCRLSSSSGTDSAQAPDGTWPNQAWVHLVCRFDNDADLITLLQDGAAAAMASKTDIENDPIAFHVSGVGVFTGQVDEVFFTPMALSDAAITRIWTCGVRGEQCRCRSDQPEQYEDCGRLDPACGALPPCNQATP